MSTLTLKFIRRVLTDQTIVDPTQQEPRHALRVVLALIWLTEEI